MREDPNAPSSFTAFLLGICMWTCCSVRLNGSSVIAVAALIQLIHLIKNKRKLDPAAVGLHLLPYGILILLSLIFNYLILLPATSNMSDLGAATWEIILRNVKNYLLVFRYFFFSIPGLPFPQILWRPSLFLFIPLLALGLLRSLKKEFPYILYLAGTVLTLLLLPYTQGTRLLQHLSRPVSAAGLLWGMALFPHCRKAETQPPEASAHSRLCGCGSFGVFRSG